MRKKWRYLPAIFVFTFTAGYLLMYQGITSGPAYDDATRKLVLNNHPTPMRMSPEGDLIVGDHHESLFQVERPPVEMIEPTRYKESAVSKPQVDPKKKLMSSAFFDNSSKQKSVLEWDIKEVLNNIDKCLNATNLKRITSIAAAARRNAERYVAEYRKVIPSSNHFLSNCSNHCWAAEVNIERRLNSLQGRIGNVSFVEPTKNFRTHSLNVLRKNFKDRFASGLICLPQTFLAGFPKCGSSFLWCFLNRLIQQSDVHAEKEPHFWIDAGAFKHFREPTASDFSNYILNFASSISRIERELCARSGVTLMDGSPNLMFNWPRFNSEDGDLANYCLIPSALPHFLPAAKFVVVMRNPIKMLYSAFWFSCTMYGIKLSPDVQLKGPSLFHDRIERKLNLFHDCMRDQNNPSISHVCSVNNANYGSCITDRFHLLDECVHRIYFNIFNEDMPKCGRSRVAMGMYFAHIRKWLSVVPRDKFLFLTLEELVEDPFKTAMAISRFLGFDRSADDVRKSANFAKTCNENSQNSINYKTNPQLYMKNETRIMLETFYKPFNQHLANLLQNSKFSWN